MWFFVEPPTRGGCYACTVEDVTRLLFEVPLDRWAGLIVGWSVLGQGRGGEANDDHHADRNDFQQPC